MRFKHKRNALSWIPDRNIEKHIVYYVQNRRHSARSLSFLQINVWIWSKADQSKMQSKANEIMEEKKCENGLLRLLIKKAYL